MINFDFETECYRCSACGSVCPTDAISFNEYLLPKVDQSVCINCKKCNNICPKEQEKCYETDFNYAKGYVCRNKDLNIRKISSSGGAFYALASYALEQGWYVAGVVYDVNFMPRHILTNDRNTLMDMLGSKYVTSNMESLIAEMSKLRKQNYCILFSGTPCQVAAVNNVFGDDSGIITVAVACHGSIDRDVWNAYLDSEIEMHGSIKSITMRDKDKGWLNYGLKFAFNNGEEHVSYRKQDGYFLKCFTSGILERDRCLSCMYKGSRISADILLADAWGMDEFFPELSDEWGLSSVLCLSQRGNLLFEKLNDRFDLKPIDYRKIIERNQRIISPAPDNLERKKFRRAFLKCPGNIQSICEKYANPGTFRRMKNKIAQFIRR